jgi:hypothetical protein
MLLTFPRTSFIALRVTATFPSRSYSQGWHSNVYMSAICMLQALPHDKTQSETAGWRSSLSLSITIKTLMIYRSYSGYTIGFAMARSRFHKYHTLFVPLAVLASLSASEQRSLL